MNFATALVRLPRYEIDLLNMTVWMATSIAVQSSTYSTLVHGALNEQW